jgi:DnaJ-domain-containing protein 1
MHHYEDMIGHHMTSHRSLAGTSDTPHEGFSSEWTSSSPIGAYKFTPQHGDVGSRVEPEKRKDVDQSVRSGMHRGIAHIWSIPNLSRSDRRNLMKHFEVQMRHHNVAAMANPRMYAEHHAGKAAQEAEAAARQQGQARERARQRASAGGSGEAPPRPRRWEHAEQPHEILGVAPDAPYSEIKKAVRKLTVKHHPDLGGDPVMMKKINDAHEHFKGRFDSLAEWFNACRMDHKKI